ncbi:MAG: hypothetical protein WAQ52_00030 [Terriglobales bacterium]
MADKKNHNEYLETIMNQLADSALSLSDEAILAEVSQSGDDPDEESERTRIVLSDVSQALENMNRRLSNLGHAINSKFWRRGHEEYYNKCLHCGSPVSFTTATGEMRGSALHAFCPESSPYAFGEQEASR